MICGGSDSVLTNEIEAVLENSKTIAVVGLSDKPYRDSYHVAEYLRDHGYRIIPVNPALTEVLGVKAYPDLKSIRDKIDVVDIFRRSEDVPPIVDAAIEIGARTIWMQIGVVHEAAAEKARKAGLTVIMDRCMLRDHHDWLQS